MSAVRSCSLFLLLVLSLCFCISAETSLYASEQKAPPYFTVIAENTIDRNVDPMIIEGKYIPSMLGLQISGMRVYSYLDGSFVPIPYQIDETTEEGYKVLPFGPEANPEMANNILDEQDEVLFMCHDFGAKLEFSSPPLNSSKFTEIEIIDPINNNKGWVYLLYFNSPAPDRTAKRYLAETDLTQANGYAGETPFLIIKGKTTEHRGKTYNQIFYEEFRTPVGAGGTAVDYADRLKWRFNVGFLFNIIKVDFNEDRLIANFLCWKMGPIRATTRAGAQAILPMGLRSPRFVADVIGYEKGVSSSTVLNIPFNPGYVTTEIGARIGTDLSPDAHGMYFFNSENLQGVLIDGVMSEEECHLSDKRDTWRLITGAQGTLMNRSTWSEPFLEQAKTVKMGYLDDAGAPDSPDDHEGQIGHAHSIAKVRTLKPDTYLIFIEWYFPPFLFDPQNPTTLDIKKVEDFLNFQDYPLEFVIESERGVNKSRPVPAKMWKS